MKRCALLLVLLVAAVASAGEPIVIGETITLDSKVMGEERTVLVSTPRGYGNSQERYPVLYMTDGDAHLTHTRGTVDFLVRNGLMPDLIIVGVTNTDRTRDLTPTHAFQVREDGSREEIINSGGAPRFLEFFAKELIPYVEDHYRTVPLRLFAGHSYGGLFALYSFASRPELFNACIAVSPSLRFDDDYILRTVGDFLKDRKELNRTLYVTMADEEEGDPSPNRFDRFRTMLAAAPAKGFIWDAKHMPDETHGSVVLRSQYWGLRKIFEGWSLPTAEGERAFNGSVDDLKKHFAALSARYGYEVMPPEGTVNTVGYGAIGNKELERAIAILRYNVILYPESANVYDSLGEALENAGRLQEAHDSYAAAAKKAEKNGDERLAMFSGNRDRVAATLVKETAPQ